MEKITSFSGDYSFLSNMFETDITFEGRVYRSSENIYQSFKTTEDSERKMISKLDPPVSKKYWRYSALRNPEFHSKKLEYMETALRAKFSNPFLAHLLLKTGDRQLLEGNWWRDQFWGVNDSNLVGYNHLGVLLMKLRKELQESK